MAQAREAYVTLDGLLHAQRKIRLQEHELPESIALAEALGSFALTHLDNIQAIPELPLPAEVQNAASTYIERIVGDKLHWAIYDQYKKQQTAQISGMLAGKFITATSLRYGHGFSDGHGVITGGGRNMLATGRFLSYDPTLATLWIGEPRHAYVISLWGRSMDYATRTLSEAEAESTLLIADN